MTDQILDAVARAICRAHCSTRLSADAVERQVENAWSVWTAEARAAIAALPTFQDRVAPAILYFPYPSARLQWQLAAKLAE